MNILFVSSQFPNSVEQNKGVFSLQIVRELACFANVQVVAPVPTLGALKFINTYKRYHTDFVIPASETIDNIKVYHPKYFAMPGMGFTHSATLFHSIKSLIETIHRQWHIDAVNCHWIFPDGVAVQKICEQLEIPIMLTPLGTDLNKFIKYRLRKKAIIDALVRSDKVSVLSLPMYNSCIALGVAPNRLQIIYNGVDLQKFTIQERSSCRKELNIRDDIKVILFVGSLVPVKGIDYLLKAFASLKKMHAVGAVKLYIVGGGFMEKELKQLACELSIHDDTEFIGTVAHEKLTAWMNSADCLCLPSLSEGHPNVIMEAMACGIPVVASAVGAIPDFVTTNTGHLVTPANPVELAEKLFKCLATSFKRESIRLAVADMSWKRCAENYYDFLKNTVVRTT